MSRRIADLLIKIGADSYEFQQKAQQVEKGLGSLEKKLTSVGKSLSLKLSAPLAALGGVSLHLADVQAKAEAKVQQALKVTNQAVGYNFRQLADYASELPGQDDIRRRNDSRQIHCPPVGFHQHHRRELQAHAGVGIGPRHGVGDGFGCGVVAVGQGALRSCDEALVAVACRHRFFQGADGSNQETRRDGRHSQGAGDDPRRIGAQVRRQAEAAARTGLGAVQQLKNAWGDFLERIGAAIMPFATKIAGALSTVVQMLQSMSPAMMQTIVVVAGLVAAVGPLSLGIGAVIKVLPMLAAGFTALLSPVGLIMAAVLALGAAFAYARIQKQKMIDEMAETESLDELERKLQENIAEQKEIIATTTKTRMVPNFGGLVAGFTLQKVPDESKLAPLRKEYDLLTAAIEKKRETEKKAAEAQAELDKVTDEARKQTEELMKSIAGTNAQTEQSTGIIGKLQERIEALEKKKLLPESTVEDIAAANAEIEKLQKELERIKNIKPEDLKPVVKKDGILPEGFELELPAPKLKMGDLKPVTSQYAQQMLAIFGAVREGLYGWADDNSAYLQEHVADTVSMVENYTTTLTAKGWSFSAALEHVHATIAEVMTRFDQQVSKFMADSIVAAAEAIGQIIAGDLGFGGLMKAILTQFASFLKNIGSQLIEFGVMIIAFKSALKSVLANPWAAIAIGAAMVAAAAVMTALINKNAEKSIPALANGGMAYGPTYAMVGDNPNAGTDPEVIAPLSKLQAMLPTGGSRRTYE